MPIILLDTQHANTTSNSMDCRRRKTVPNDWNPVTASTSQIQGYEFDGEESIKHYSERKGRQKRTTREERVALFLMWCSLRSLDPKVFRWQEMVRKKKKSETSTSGLVFVDRRRGGKERKGENKKCIIFGCRETKRRRSCCSLLSPFWWIVHKRKPHTVVNAFYELNALPPFKHLLVPDSSLLWLPILCTKSWQKIYIRLPIRSSRASRHRTSICSRNKRAKHNVEKRDRRYAMYLRKDGAEDVLKRSHSNDFWGQLSPPVWLFYSCHYPCVACNRENDTQVTALASGKHSHNTFSTKDSETRKK